MSPKPTLKLLLAQRLESRPPAETPLHIDCQCQIGNDGRRVESQACGGTSSPFRGLPIPGFFPS
eukprot:1447610-Amphidinium_carterae.1